MKTVGALPWVTPVAKIVLVGSYVAEAGLALAWFLRCLEIPSIFDRWLPGSAWFVLMWFVLGLIGQGVWSTLVALLDENRWGGRATHGPGAGMPTSIPAIGATTVDGTSSVPSAPAGKWGSVAREHP